VGTLAFDAWEASSFTKEGELTAELAVVASGAMPGTEEGGVKVDGLALFSPALPLELIRMRTFG